MVKKYILIIALALTFGLTGTAAVWAQTVNTVSGAEEWQIVRTTEHTAEDRDDTDRVPEGAPEAGMGGSQR
jgi:hypothetical protein